MAAGSNSCSSLEGRDEQTRTAAGRRMRFPIAISYVRVVGLVENHTPKHRYDGFIIFTLGDWPKSRRVFAKSHRIRLNCALRFLRFALLATQPTSARCCTAEPSLAAFGYQLVPTTTNVSAEALIAQGCLVSSRSPTVISYEQSLLQPPAFGQYHPSTYSRSRLNPLPVTILVLILRLLLCPFPNAFLANCADPLQHWLVGTGRAACQCGAVVSAVVFGVQSPMPSVMHMCDQDAAPM